MSTPLSPAAQSVLDAFGNASDGEYVDGVWVVNERTMLAAALRAVADQVVPYIKDPGGSREGERQCVRREILAIAAELEGSNG